MLDEQSNREYHSGDPTPMGDCIDCSLPVWDPEETNDREQEGFEREDEQVQHFDCYRWSRLQDLAAQLNTATAELAATPEYTASVNAAMGKVIALAALLVEVAE